MKDVIFEFHKIIFQVRLKCVQMYTSVIQHFGKDRAGSFIKGFAPKLTEYLIAVKDNSSIIDKELNIIFASLGAFESLVPLAEETKSKSVLMIRSK